jgi:uncharacterized membrane protein
MDITLFLKIVFVSIPVFVVCDLLWLGLIARNFYQTRLGHLLGPIEWGAAIVFYGLFLIGLTFFATYDAVVEDNWIKALTMGAAFGFFTYMTYDLTNMATLRDWPLSIVIVDILWGTVLGGVVASVAYFATGLFK